MEEKNSRQPSDPLDAQDLSEAPSDFEDQPELAPVIEQLRAEESTEPQSDFTLRVMAGISEVQSETAEAAATVQRFRERSASLMRYLTETPSVSDIALCFLLAGFFYFLLGVIFFFGLQTIEPLPAMAAWLRLQPQVAMCTAGVLGTIGLLLLLNGGIAMRLARIGTIAYIGFSIFNGMWIGLMNVSSYRPFGLLCFAAAPVLLGVFLAASLQRYRRRMFAG